MRSYVKTESPLLPCAPFDLMMTHRSTETHNIIVKTRPYLGPNSEIPGAPIILQDV